MYQPNFIEIHLEIYFYYKLLKYYLIYYQNIIIPSHDKVHKSYVVYVTKTQVKGVQHSQQVKSKSSTNKKRMPRI